jgi:protein TonB
MNKQMHVSQEDALEILFSNRNRAYGAYQLRRQYPTTLARALGIGLVIIALMIALPQIMRAVSSLMPVENEEPGERIIKDIVVELPPLQPPPLAATPPPPTRATQRFVPPVVEEDQNVNEEPPKLSNEDLVADPSDIGKASIDAPETGPPTIDEQGVGLVETPATVINDDPVEVVDVQIPPRFPGGEAELMRYLAKQIRYPEMAREANIQGVVVVSFVIGKDGSISEVSVIKDIGGGCGKEAIRVLKSMPNWLPGESNGHKFKVRFTLPVRFKLQ